jgi:hypothetical protein
VGWWPGGPTPWCAHRAPPPRIGRRPLASAAAPSDRLPPARIGCRPLGSVTTHLIGEGLTGCTTGSSVLHSALTLVTRDACQRKVHRPERVKPASRSPMSHPPAAALYLPPKEEPPMYTQAPRDPKKLPWIIACVAAVWPMIGTPFILPIVLSL